jgi:ATP-dependent Zn protease
MSITAILINMLPIILLIGVWIFFMIQMKKRTPAADAQQAYMASHLEETRRMNLTLERIATALEERRGA